VDPLILSAATALVTAMVTDGWQAAREGAVKLWRRVHPDRAPAVEAELAEVRADLLAARQSGNASAEGDLAAEWARKLARLVAADQAIAGEIARTRDESWLPLLSAQDQARVQAISLSATAHGQAQVNQAGRDLTMTATDGGVIARDITGGVSTGGNPTPPGPR
jgi:hypothetical protein